MCSSDLQRGYEAGKRIKGRKHHIASDTMGLLLTVVAPSAGIQDRVGAKALLVRLFMRMVIGLVPVIGIPLPFFSYGGSSLWGFTLLIFIFSPA